MFEDEAPLVAKQGIRNVAARWEYRHEHGHDPEPGQPWNAEQLYKMRHGADAPDASAPPSEAPRQHPSLTQGISQLFDGLF